MASLSSGNNPKAGPRAEPAFPHIVMLKPGYDIEGVLDALCAANHISERHRPEVTRRDPDGTNYINCSLNHKLLLEKAEGVESIKPESYRSPIT